MNEPFKVTYVLISGKASSILWNYYKAFFLDKEIVHF